VRLSGAGRVLAALAIALFVSAPVVAALLHQKAVADRVERDALLQSAEIVTGTVTRLKRDSDSKKRAWVDYQFVADGLTYSRRAKIPTARWQALSVGGTLPVRYLPADPATNIPDGVAPSVLPVALPYILAPLLVLCGLLCWLNLRYQRRLLTDGRPVIAVVKSISKQRTQHGPHYRMRYEFPLMNGAMQPGSAATSAKGPGVGSSIVVLYDDERPKSSRPYPLSLVRVVDGD
jgi:hypothetical protein